MDRNHAKDTRAHNGSKQIPQHQLMRLCAVTVETTSFSAMTVMMTHAARAATISSTVKTARIVSKVTRAMTSSLVVLMTTRYAERTARTSCTATVVMMRCVVVRTTTSSMAVPETTA